MYNISAVMTDNDLDKWEIEITGDASVLPSQRLSPLRVSGMITSGIVQVSKMPDWMSLHTAKRMLLNAQRVSESGGKTAEEL